MSAGGAWGRMVCGSCEGRKGFASWAARRPFGQYRVARGGVWRGGELGSAWSYLAISQVVGRVVDDECWVFLG